MTMSSRDRSLEDRVPRVSRASRDRSLEEVEIKTIVLISRGHSLTTTMIVIKTIAMMTPSEVCPLEIRSLGDIVINSIVNLTTAK